MVQVSKQPQTSKIDQGKRERRFQASEARAPEHSVARCKALFCVVSLGAKQGLHRVSDSLRSNHDLITFDILLMKHFCALWLFKHLCQEGGFEVWV